MPPDQPNRHPVCPPGLCRTADGDSPVFPVGVEAQAAAWNRLLECEGARRVAGRDGQIDVEV